MLFEDLRFVCRHFGVVGRVVASSEATPVFQAVLDHAMKTRE